MELIIINKNSELIDKRNMVIVEYPGLLAIFNSIIDWDACKFPGKIIITELENSTEEENQETTTPMMQEDRSFLGDPPKLVPNIRFIYEGQQLMFLDENKVGLLHSDTGILGIFRVINNFALLEYKLKERIYSIKTVETPKQLELRILGDCEAWLNTPIYTIDSLEIIIEDKPEEIEILELVELKLPHFIIKEFLKDLSKYSIPNCEIVKLKVKTEVDIFEINILMNTNTGKIYYSKQEVLDTEHIRSEVLSIFSEIINKKTKD